MSEASLFRCGEPGQDLAQWIRTNAKQSLRISTYNLSSYEALGSLLAGCETASLLVGIGLQAPSGLRSTLQFPLPDHWHKLLALASESDRFLLLQVLKRASTWNQAGIEVRVAPAGIVAGKLCNALHAKSIIGDSRALVGSANFTRQGLLSLGQSEVLVEVAGPAHQQLTEWWHAAWEEAWPVGEVSNLPTVSRSHKESIKEDSMSIGRRALLGHWLGSWGAWALNGNGVVAYPHQLQAVDWIRPAQGAFLLGDEVGLGKTFTAAMLWLRHMQLHGAKARLIYITKPSLLVDVVSAFVSVLGEDKFLKPRTETPQTTNDFQIQFSIYHDSTRLWELLRDDTGKKTRRDFHVASLLNEERYRVQPEQFAKLIRWMTHYAARTLHDNILIDRPSDMVKFPMTFVSMDTLRGREDSIALVHEKLVEGSFVPLVIVDESHGVSMTSLRRKVISRMLWGERRGDERATYRIPGSLTVFMTGTPIHPSRSETSSRLALLDCDAEKFPIPSSWYDDPTSPDMRALFARVKGRAVIRRKESVTLDGTIDGTKIFPKRLVFPFRKWFDTNPTKADLDVTGQTDILLAVDRYVASEASHGAKLFSRIRAVLRACRDLTGIQKLIASKDSDTGTSTDSPTFAQRLVKHAESHRAATKGDEQEDWNALLTAIQAAKTYEEKLKDERLRDLTWREGTDDNGNPERQLLFPKVGWTATVYDTLKKPVISREEDEETGEEIEDESETLFGEQETLFNLDRPDLLQQAEEALSLAESYLEPVKLNDESKIRFSMLVALLEGLAQLRMWSEEREAVGVEDRFGWGLDSAAVKQLKSALQKPAGDLNIKDACVVHARYIHSVVDTAVRLQLRYGQKGQKPVVGIIIGDTPNAKRNEIKEAFQSGALKLICMSDAGAEGINLQRSNRIVLLDVPVSPGRIEQIAGRIHRLGSTHAAQVTLLLPPGHFGSRVFKALRDSAREVFKTATGEDVPKPPRQDSLPEPYFIRKLAEHEGNLLTAVAQASGLLREESNRSALQRLVSELADPERAENLVALREVMKQGWSLIQEQKKQFEDASMTTQSAFMPEMQDLVDALKQFTRAKTEISPETYRVPVSIVDEQIQPDRYGDLVTNKEPFERLKMYPEDPKSVWFWFGRRRFLPSDIPGQPGARWLGVMGNPEVEAVLRDWRREKAGVTPDQRKAPLAWTTSGLKKGKAIAFCGVRNFWSRDGKVADERVQQQHVLLGLRDASTSSVRTVWTPFFAQGSVVARKVFDDTWLKEVLAKLDHRWAAKLVRVLSGLEAGVSTGDPNATSDDVARELLKSVIVDFADEDGEQAWRLDPAVLVRAESTQPGWWAGGKKPRCIPEFFLVAVGSG